LIHQQLISAMWIGGDYFSIDNRIARTKTIILPKAASRESEQLSEFI
jgi:hypothetical protein